MVRQTYGERLRQAIATIPGKVQAGIRMDVISEKIGIDHWSRESQLLFYLAIKSFIIWILAFFLILPGFVPFLNLIFDILMLGFIFARADQRYNVPVVLVSMFALGFVVTPFGQLSMWTANNLAPGEPVIQAWDDEGNLYYLYGFDYAADGKNLKLVLVSTGEEVRWNSKGKPVHADGTVINLVDFDDKTALFIGNDGRKYYLVNDTFIDEEGYPLWQDADKKWRSSNPHSVGEQVSPDPVHGDTMKAIGETLRSLQGTSWTMENIGAKFMDFITLINWILILFLIGYGISMVGDIITIQWGNVAKKSATIAVTIALYTLIVSILRLPKDGAGKPIANFPTMWETAGNTWNSIMKKIGLMQLDSAGNVTEFSLRTVTNGVVAWLPLIMPVCLVSLGLYFRKRDLGSILFARKLRAEVGFEIEKPTKFRLTVLVLILAYAIYLMGYVLINTDVENIPGGRSPLLAVTFAIVGILALVLIGFNLIYLHPKVTVWSTIQWTVYGFTILMLYFQFVQPLTMDAGWRDTPSDMTYLGQNASILDSDVLQQLFLVAMPETLIFQVLFIGVMNRVYYYLREEKALERQRETSEAKAEKLRRQHEAITSLLGSQNSDARNLKLLVEAAQIQQSIARTEASLRPKPISHRYFIIPSLIWAFGGSFLFSWYHSFRRGYSFNAWFRSNNGFSFMGAGFVLSFVAFFNFFSAILVHWINNVICALMG